jgi:hypothetical protein
MRGSFVVWLEALNAGRPHQHRDGSSTRPSVEALMCGQDALPDGTEDEICHRPGRRATGKVAALAVMAHIAGRNPEWLDAVRPN